MGRSDRAVGGKITGVAAILDRHGDAVEADLAASYGVNVCGLYTGELTYRRAAVLIAHLPPQSATKTIVRDSLTDAEQAALSGDGEGHGAWSHSDLLLATIADAVHVLVWQQSQIHGKKRARAPKPIPRPGIKRSGAAAGHGNDGRAVSPAGVTYLSELRERRRLTRGS